MLLDPHTAVGVGVAQRLERSTVPIVTLATAHPAKFPDAVEHATGVRPALPEHLADLFDRPERLHRVTNDLKLVEHKIAEIGQASLTYGLARFPGRCLAAADLIVSTDCDRRGSERWHVRRKGIGAIGVVSPP